MFPLLSMNKLTKMMIKSYSNKIPIVPKLINRFIRVIYSCDIPPSVKLGSGTVFVHNGLGVVLHEKATIGKNCRIYQGVTVGGRGKSGTPIIEDNVFIGANSTIIGGIRIGENSVIGANSLVLHDVPPNIVVAGNPAKQIN